MQSKSSVNVVQSVRIRNKLGKFVNDPSIRSLVDARKSTMGFRKALDKGKTIIVDLGALKGTDSLGVPGAMLLSRVLITAFSRDISSETSREHAFLFLGATQLR